MNNIEKNKDNLKSIVVIMSLILVGLFMGSLLINSSNYLFNYFTGQLDDIASLEERVAKEYPLYYALVLKGGPLLKKVEIIDSPTINYSPTTSPKDSKWIAQNFYSLSYGNVIDEAYLYLEASVGGSAFSDNDKIYFKLNNTGGRINIINSKTVESPPSKDSTKLLLDLSNISYVTDQDLGGEEKEDVNLIDSVLNKNFINEFTGGISLSILSDNGPIELKRFALIYKSKGELLIREKPDNWLY